MSQIKKYSSKIKYILLFVLVLLNVRHVEAQTQSSSFITASNAPEYIARIYWYGSAIVSGVAVLIIVIAGVNYLRSMGNTEVIQRSKQLIMGSLAGLFLVIGGYFILKTIDPRLVNLKIEVPVSETSTVKGDTCQSLRGQSCSKNGEVVTCLDNTSYKCVPADASFSWGKLTGSDQKFSTDQSQIQCVNGVYKFAHQKLLSRSWNSKFACGCDTDTPNPNVLFATVDCASGKSFKDVQTTIKNIVGSDCIVTDTMCTTYTGSTGSNN